jgi:D-beta-D-heptose 7-phosphate kinase/D-beta-D-heptose 1-phosphate adenosyltransferase
VSASAARLSALLERFRRVRLLVVGDVVLDEYLSGTVDRVSPEAPVPVVHVRSESTVLGGAANVARNAVALGAGVALCSVVGDDAAGRRTTELVEALGVDPSGLVVAPGRTTTRKTRVVARSQQIVRFDRETHDGIPPACARRLLEAVATALPGVQGVVVEDYGKGIFAGRTGAALMRLCRAARVPVAVDPKSSLAPWRGAALLKPNLREAAALSGLAVDTPEALARAAARLLRRLGGGALAVTRGADGMTLFEGRGPGLPVPTARREVFDVQGAGDTAIAALALALRAGASLFEAAVIANAAAGVVVGKVGTATAGVDEVREQLPAALAAAKGRAR